MINECNSDLSHHQMQQMLIDRLRHLDYCPRAEYSLPNGKIADIWLETREGTAIIEVKTRLTPFIIGSVWIKYSNHCNMLVIAAPPQEVRYALQPVSVMQWPKHTDQLGFVAVSWDELKVVRHPIPRMLIPSITDRRAGPRGVLVPSGAAPATEKPLAG